MQLCCIYSPYLSLSSEFSSFLWVIKSEHIVLSQDDNISCNQTRSLEGCPQTCTFHVVGVCLLSQSPPKKTQSRKKKPTYLCAPREFFQQMGGLCLIIIQSSYFDYRINKSFTCSRCVICVSCSVHVISRYYVRKGSWSPTNQQGQEFRSRGWEFWSGRKENQTKTEKAREKYEPIDVWLINNKR